MTAPPGPVRLAVLLHGAGDDPSRLAHLVGRPAGATVITPVGPHQLESGPAWLPADSVHAGAAEVGAVLDGLDQAIDRATAENGIDRASTALVGFSQGAAAALALAFRTGARPVAAVIALAGFLWPPDQVTYQPGGTDRSHVPEVLFVHGTDDDAVPVPQGRSAARWLERHGVPTAWHEIEAGHDPARLVPVALDWLAGRAPG